MKKGWCIFVIFQNNVILLRTLEICDGAHNEQTIRENSNDFLKETCI